jgi:thiol-disulfide isomerase/thioredoxin
MKKLAALFILSSLFLIQNSFADGIEFIHDKTFREILDMAKAQNKLVFIDCYTSWCGPCKRLAATVFPDREVGDFYNSTFINTKFDMEKEEGPTIAGKYSIRAYPTLLWLDGDGKVVLQHVGGLDPQGLIEQGKKAIDPTPGILAGMRSDYANGKRDVDFLSSYLNTLNNSAEKYDDVFKEYLDKLSPKELSDPKHAKTIFSLTNDIKSPGLSYVMKNRDAYVKLVSADVFNKKINAIATKAVKEAPRAEDKALFEAALDLLKTNKADDSAQKSLELSMNYYERTNDWLNYDKAASQYIKKYVSKDAAMLNDVAWTYFLNVNDVAQLQKATKWAYEAVNTDNKYTYNLTYAYLLYKQNNYKEAERACDYAIIRANEENVQPSSATALKDAIKKSLVKQ